MKQRPAIASTSDQNPWAPEMIKECNDLGIRAEKCSEIEILKHLCLGGPGSPCGSHEVPQPKLGPVVAEIWAGSGTAFVASVAGVKQLRGVKGKPSN